MLKRVFSLLLCLLVMSQACLAFAYDGTEFDGPIIVPEDSPSIPNVGFALLYEETTGTVMLTKYPDRTNAPASMTKVMTALLVLEQNPTLEGSTVVPPEAVSEKYCYWMDTWHLEAGEEVTIRDLMNYFLIVSGNEAGTTLAAHVAGDIDTFIQMMNDKADELGMTKTHYADPHGLSELNRISCEDMLILVREAMKYDLFREIVSSPNGTMPATNKHHKPYRYNSTNRVMCPRNIPEYENEFKDDIIGVKTGYISAAGYNLTCCMDYDEEDLLFYSIVMSGKSVPTASGNLLGSHLETINIMRWARTFHKEGVAAGEEVATAATQGSDELNIRLAAAGDALMLTRTSLQREIVLNEIGRQVKAGDVLGVLKLTDDFGNVKEIELTAMNDAVTDRSTEYMIMTGLSVGSIALLAVISTFLRKKSRA